MKRNILFCSPRGSVGGICRWTENILAYAEAEGQSELTLKWYYSTVPEMAVGNSSFIKRIYSGLKTYLPFVRGLNKIIKYGNYDMAHFSTSGSISFMRDYLALKMCRRAGIPTALHFHFGRMAQVLASKSLEKRLFDLCIPYISKFVAMDDATYKALLAYGCENVYLVPNPLSPQVEAAITKLPRMQRSSNTIVFAGHVLRTKGIFELVEACRNIPDIKLEILGQCASEIRAELFETAGPHASEWVNIRGNCSMEQVLESMMRCDVFVLPTYTEGFPNVILEAMACGCAIISTPVGAIPQMLEDEDGKKFGLFVEPKNPNALHDAIESLIDNDILKQEMRKNVRLRVSERYNIHSVWNELITIWKN